MKYEETVKQISNFLEKLVKHLNIRNINEEEIKKQAERIVKNEIVLFSNPSPIKPKITKDTPVSTKVSYYLSKIIESLPEKDNVLYLIGSRIIDEYEEYNRTNRVSSILKLPEVDKFIKFMFTRFKNKLNESKTKTKKIKINTKKHNKKHSLLAEEYRKLKHWTLRS